MTGPVLLALDQGTSATKAVLVDERGTIVARATAPLRVAHPRPGWVEQDAEEILESVRAATAACLTGRDPASVAAVGFSTQRESVVLWHRADGKPVGPLLSWQDRRTTARHQELVAAGAAPTVRRLSGLPLDPMFSALKAAWLLDAHDPDRSRCRAGELCLGTVDSWLLARFGAEHLTEVGNASRTQLLDVATRSWSDELCGLFDVPRAALPAVVGSTGPFPAVRGLAPLPDGVPITGVAGDSHAALFAHSGWRPGTVKATYGTGSSIMGVVPRPGVTGDALATSVAWDTGDPSYAVEGNIRATGATLTWVADLLGRTQAEVADLAAVSSSDGVHLVPAFTGLGAPWWEERAVGVLTDLTLGTGAPQLARAALEAIAFQVEDVVRAVEAEVGRIDTLLADGGPSANPVLMQLQADTSGRAVRVPAAGDLSALGVARLAGLGAGMWTAAGLDAMDGPGTTYEPRLAPEARGLRIADWHAAVARSFPADRAPAAAPRPPALHPPVPHPEGTDHVDAQP